MNLPTSLEKTAGSTKEGNRLFSGLTPNGSYGILTVDNVVVKGVITQSFSPVLLVVRPMSSARVRRADLWQTSFHTPSTARSNLPAQSLIRDVAPATLFTEIAWFSHLSMLRNHVPDDQ